MMIKGRYVATIEIDIAIPEDTPNLLPFDEIREKAYNGLDAELHDLIQDEFDGVGAVRVTKQYADIYRCSEECIEFSEEQK